jgi:hypothetical protein
MPESFNDLINMIVKSVLFLKVYQLDTVQMKLLSLLSDLTSIEITFPIQLFNVSYSKLKEIENDPEFNSELISVNDFNKIQQMFFKEIDIRKNIELLLEKMYQLQYIRLFNITIRQFLHIYNLIAVVENTLNKTSVSPINFVNKDEENLETEIKAIIETIESDIQSNCFYYLTKRRQAEQRYEQVINITKKFGDTVCEHFKQYSYQYIMKLKDYIANNKQYNVVKFSNSSEWCTVKKKLNDCDDFLNNIHVHISDVKEPEPESFNKDIKEMTSALSTLASNDKFLFIVNLGMRQVIKSKDEISLLTKIKMGSVYQKKILLILYKCIKQAEFVEKKISIETNFVSQIDLLNLEDVKKQIVVPFQLELHTNPVNDNEMISNNVSPNEYQQHLIIIKQNLQKYSPFPSFFVLGRHLLFRHIIFFTIALGMCFIFNKHLT